MNEYTITCGSTADLPYEFYKENNIKYGCFHFELDGIDYIDDLGKTMPYEKFYKKLDEGAIPSTSQLTQSDYINLWKPILKEGNNIIDIGLSSGITGGFNSALLAKDELLKEFPDRKIAVIDSIGATAGYGMLVSYAADKKKEGMNFEQLVDYLEELKTHIHLWFYSTDLTGYLRGGRISKTSHIFGTMLKICPVMNVNIEGKLIPRDKIRGKNKAKRLLFEKMVEHAQNGKNYDGKCFISHSDCYDDALELKELIENEFPKLKDKVFITMISSVIGAHCHKGTVCLSFVGDKRD
ncbi:MAG: DegV family protein [Tissierellia bacterium]|nr:DegV family protein [Tissierellia bacterium]